MVQPDKKSANAKDLIRPHLAILARRTQTTPPGTPAPDASTDSTRRHGGSEDAEYRFLLVSEATRNQLGSCCTDYAAGKIGNVFGPPGTWVTVSGGFRSGRFRTQTNL